MLNDRRGAGFGRGMADGFPPANLAQTTEGRRHAKRARLARRHGFQPMRSIRKLLVEYGWEAALVLLLVSLMMQLTWPTLVAWQNQPQPGRMVVQTLGAASSMPLFGLASEYQLYLPRTFGETGKQWPLLLYLHGAGDRGWNPRYAKRYGLPLHLGTDFHLPAVVVVPQCPPNQSWTPESLTVLLDEVEPRYRIHARHVVVAGYSIGGLGAWSLACHAPDRIAAAVILAGGGEPKDAGRAQGVAIWALHGADDAVVPPNASQEIVAALQAAGGDARYTVLQGEGHGIQDVLITRPEILQWLLAQKKPMLDKHTLKSSLHARASSSISTSSP